MHCKLLKEIYEVVNDSTPLFTKDDSHRPRSLYVLSHYLLRNPNTGHVAWMIFWYNELTHEKASVLCPLGSEKSSVFSW